MTDIADIAIIGGGAAGLTTAIFAGPLVAQGKRIVIMDSAKTLGAKILVSGGGRCNVTHDVVNSEDFNGSRPVVRNILAAFPAQATVNWFASMGVQLKREETGKLFPVADTARSVLNAMLRRCGELGVVIQGESRVIDIKSPGESHSHFTIEHQGGALSAVRVVMCTGGKSLPRSGSDGLGWEIVERLGHTVMPTYAALAPLVLDQRMFHASVAGIAQEVQLQTFVDGRMVDRRRGSLLWTHFGISGPVVMDASRYWIIAHESGLTARMECNLLAPDTHQAVDKWLVQQAAQRPRAGLVTVLSTRLPERISRALIEYCNIDSAVACGQLSRGNRRVLVASLTALQLPVLRHRGWNYAEVTAGGVPLDEINYRTMESRKVPGFYLTGEILDCDGRIGGFNFQWAWATGHIAGSALQKCYAVL